MTLDVPQIAETQQRKIDVTEAQIAELEIRIEEERATLSRLRELQGKSEYTVQEINYLLQFVQ